MGEQASDRIAMDMDTDSNLQRYQEQLSVAISNIGALNLNDSIHHRGSNLYNHDTWESVLNYPRNRKADEVPKASESGAAALNKSIDNGSVYDCNICLDLAKEPVVTCCGHLFCWPCIYRWLNLRSSRIRTKECPVCKGEVTDKDVIPIYGVGNSDEIRNEDSSSTTPQIPRRPNARRVSRDLNARPVLGDSWNFNARHVSRDLNARPVFGDYRDLNARLVSRNPNATPYPLDLNVMQTAIHQPGLGLDISNLYGAFQFANQ
ncbi:hypothetical protein TSUD_24730 [Trifolium subterraneum]|uniref:E3 ubiquitin-protein ligase RMA n=1 Tax=Trifolium subterraneum TaxID=3900 RepID=A0A2Z6P6B1_TRISU|nr:hypothetical protein TSUD_24730 [Trifolium subterraneum]